MKNIGVIDNFNNSVRIEEVYERVTGNKIGKSSNCKCPFHKSSIYNNNNAAIDLKRNSFSCFSHKCATSMKAFEFIAKYHNLENEKFPIIARKINEYYPKSFIIYSKSNRNFKSEEKDFVLSNLYKKIEKELRSKITERITVLNEFFFDKQGIKVDIRKMKQLWNYVKINEFYSCIANYVKIDENIGSFKINETILNAVITNKVLKYRNKHIELNKAKKNIIKNGKKIADKYKNNPSNELKERLEQYRFEYKLINRNLIEIKNDKLSIKEKLVLSNRAGLEYLQSKNIENILRSNKLYNLNRKICEVISEQEKNAFICGNIDYTVSIVDIKPFNDNNKLIEKKHIKYIEKELESLRKKIGSIFNDRYFCDKELSLNKKIMKFM